MTPAICSIAQFSSNSDVYTEDISRKPDCNRVRFQKISAMSRTVNSKKSKSDVLVSPALAESVLPQ